MSDNPFMQFFGSEDDSDEETGEPLDESNDENVVKDVAYITDSDDEDQVSEQNQDSEQDEEQDDDLEHSDEIDEEQYDDLEESDETDNDLEQDDDKHMEKETKQDLEKEKTENQNNLVKQEQELYDGNITVKELLVSKETPKVHTTDGISNGAEPEIVDEPPEEEETQQGIVKQKEQEAEPPIQIIEFKPTEEQMEKQRQAIEQIAKAPTKTPEEIIKQVERMQPKQELPHIGEQERFYFFRVQNTDDPSKIGEFTLPGDIPMKIALKAIIDKLEGKEIVENRIQYYLDNKDKKTEISDDLPKNFVIDNVGTEIPRVILYNVLPTAEQEVTIPGVVSPSTVVPTLPAPSKPEPRAVPKKKPKEKPRLKVSEYVPFKEIKVEMLVHLMNIVKEPTDSDKYKESRDWIQYNGANDPKVRNAIYRYLEYKIETSEKETKLKKKGGEPVKMFGVKIPWIQTMHIVDDWIENYLSFERFAKVKKREKVKKEETVFKVKYDPKTGKTQVKESKYSKALRRAATQYIKKFEKEFPEYFTEDFFEKTQSKLKKFAEKEETFEPGSIPRVHQKYAELKKTIKGEEEEELIQNFFIFSQKPLSRKEIYDRWKAIFTLSSSAKKLIDQMIENTDEFKKVKSDKYLLKEETLLALSKDSEFTEFLNYIDQVINGPTIDEEEVQNEEKLALEQEAERTEYIKQFSSLPLKAMRSAADITKMLRENVEAESEKKFKITVEDKEGNTIPIPDEKFVDGDYQYLVEIKKSRIPSAGEGLFALEGFEQGDRIAKYSGQILTEEEFNERYGEHELAAYTVPVVINHNGIDYTYYIDADNNKLDLGRFANDYRGSKKKKPNAEIIYVEGSDIWDDFPSLKQPILKYVDVWLEATEPIVEGDEIYIDYGEDYWKETLQKEVTMQKEQAKKVEAKKEEKRVLEKGIESKEEYQVMQKVFTFTPEKTVAWKDIEKLIHSAEYTKAKNAFIESSVPLYTDLKMKTAEVNYLLANLWANIRKSKVKQLQQHKNFDLLFRSAFIMYIVQNKSFEKDITNSDKFKIQAYARKVLEIVPNDKLVPLNINTNKKSFEEMRSMLYNLVEHGFPNEKKILNKPYKEYSTLPEFKKFIPELQENLPNRMDIIMAYHSIVKDIKFNSAEYENSINSVIERFNSGSPGSLPSIDNPAWSIIQSPF